MAADQINPLLAPLVDRRRATGMTQRELSDRVRRCQEQVNKWERGVNEPCLRNLQSWCDALGYELTIKPKDETT